MLYLGEKSYRHFADKHLHLRWIAWIPCPKGQITVHHLKIRKIEVAGDVVERHENFLQQKHRGALFMPTSFKGAIIFNTG